MNLLNKTKSITKNDDNDNKKINNENKTITNVMNDKRGS